MARNAVNTNDLIDGLVRQMFDIEPEVMASLAHDDAQVRLRRLPDLSPTTDPLDGLEVFVRRTVATCIALRRHAGAVSLVTERQARAAGWPNARLANMVLVLALALYNGSEPTRAVPVLVEADDDAPNHVLRLIRLSGRLPSLEKLQRVWRRGWRIDTAAMQRTAQTRENAPSRAGSKLVRLNELLQGWLSIDARRVELPGDRRPGDGVSSSGARAMCYFECLAVEALEMGHVMQTEVINAVRLKTEEDARIARQPGAVAANLALLLGAAVCHGSGYTVHFLPEHERFAAALIEAGQRFQGGHGLAGILDIEDLAGRGYIHVGKRAARHAARRIIDTCIVSAA